MEGHLKGALCPLESIQANFACSSVNFTLYVIIKCERHPHRNSVLLGRRDLPANTRRTIWRRKWSPTRDHRPDIERDRKVRVADFSYIKTADKFRVRCFPDRFGRFRIVG